jgi:hypothetical protein
MELDSDDQTFFTEIELQIITICHIKKLTKQNSDLTSLAKLISSSTSLIQESLKRLSKNRHSIFILRSNQVSRHIY